MDVSGQNWHSVRVNTYNAKVLLVEAPELPQRLDESMRIAGLGVRELAARSGVDKGTISSWRRGAQSRVRVEKVMAVARELGTSAEELLGLPPTEGASSASPSQGAEEAELLRGILPQLRDLVEVAESLEAKA